MYDNCDDSVIGVESLPFFCQNDEDFISTISNDRDRTKHALDSYRHSEATNDSDIENESDGIDTDLDQPNCKYYNIDEFITESNSSFDLFHLNSRSLNIFLIRYPNISPY